MIDNAHLVPRRKQEFPISGALKMIELDPRTSALVMIDLQKGILANALAPISGAELLARGQALAERFRAAAATVVLVHVAFSADGRDMLRPRVDEPAALPKDGFPAAWSEFPAGLAQPGDLLITKRQWSAFHGTELDLQLRRRGVRTIVLGGVSTQIGVESTARQAYEHGYELVIAREACASSVAEGHDMSMKLILPRLARLASSTELSFARGGS
jgi:nicotinamidase-related amidase